MKHQQGSRFGAHPVLDNRYLLMNLLGRGGFSEVYKVRPGLGSNSQAVCCGLPQRLGWWLGGGLLAGWARLVLYCLVAFLGRRPAEHAHPLTYAFRIKESQFTTLDYQPQKSHP
jgi:hypothetical protein